jgi:hypothetical protein
MIRVQACAVVSVMFNFSESANDPRPQALSGTTWLNTCDFESFPDFTRLDTALGE